MGVGIHDHDLDVRLLVLQVADGDGDIVENAITLAVPAERMMRAARKTDADAFGQRGVTGEAGSFDLGDAALVELGRERQA